MNPLIVEIDADTTIGDVIEPWIVARLARREIMEATAQSHRHWLLDFARFVGPDTPLGAINTRVIEAWLAQPRQDGKPYGAASLKNRANVLRSLFGWAEAGEIVDKNPTTGIQRIRQPKRTPRAVDREEVQRMLWVAGMRDRTIILTAVHLGLRLNELHLQNVEHWSRKDRTLRVVGKGDRERILPVEGELAAALELWVDLGLGGRRAGPMWTTQGADSDRLSRSQIGQRIRNIGLEAGLKVTPHQLRHSCASDLAAAGVPVNVISAWLGHQSLDTTSIYTTVHATALRSFAAIRTYLPNNLAMPSLPEPGGDFS